MARNNSDMIPADWELPLTFKSCDDAFGRPDDSGVVQVASDILWIPGPFAHDFWSKARKKPKSIKCQCVCGHKHSPPKGKDGVAT